MGNAEENALCFIMHGFGWLVGNKGWECKETRELLYHKEAF